MWGEDIQRDHKDVAKQVPADLPGGADGASDWSFHTSKTSSMTASETRVILLCAAAGYQTQWLRTCRCHWPLWLCSIWLMKKWVKLQLPLEFWFAHVKTCLYELCHQQNLELVKVDDMSDIIIRQGQWIEPRSLSGAEASIGLLSVFLLCLNLEDFVNNQDSMYSNVFCFLPRWNPYFYSVLLM